MVFQVEGFDIQVRDAAAVRGAKTIKRSLGDIGSEAVRAQTNVDRMSGALTGLRGAVSNLRTAFAGLGFGLLVRELTRTNSAFASLRASLETVEGSATRAQAAFKQLESFAASTPFSLQEVASAFVRLRALGLDPSEKALTSFGNTASAMSKSLNQVVEAVADATTGEFERLKEFGIRAKTEGDRVTFTFRGVSTEVGKNVDEIQAFLRAIGEVEFAGAMERQADTIVGALSNLGDSFDSVQRKIGDAGFSSAVTQLARELSDFANQSDALAGSIGSGLGSAINTLTTTLKATRDSAETIIGVASVVAKLAATYGVLRLSQRAATAATLALNDSFLGFIGGLINTGLVSQTTGRHMAFLASRAKLATFAMTAFKRALPFAAVFIAIEALTSLAFANDILANSADRAREALQKERSEVNNLIARIEAAKKAVGEAGLTLTQIVQAQVRALDTQIGNSLLEIERLQSAVDQVRGPSLVFGDEVSEGLASVGQGAAEARRRNLRQQIQDERAIVDEIEAERSRLQEALSQGIPDTGTGRPGSGTSSGADKLAKEFDRLRASLDPAFAASQRFETGLAIIEKSLTGGASDLALYTQLLEALGKEYQKATAQAEPFSASVGRQIVANDNLITALRTSRREFEIVTEQQSLVQSGFEGTEEAARSAAEALANQERVLRDLQEGYSASDRAAQEWARTQQRALDKAQRDAERFGDAVRDSFADTFDGLFDPARDGFRDFLDDLSRDLRRFASEILADVLVRQVLGLETSGPNFGGGLGGILQEILGDAFSSPGAPTVPAVVTGNVGGQLGGFGFPEIDQFGVTLAKQTDSLKTFGQSVLGAGTSTAALETAEGNVTNAIFTQVVPSLVSQTISTAGETTVSGIATTALTAFTEAVIAATIALKTLSGGGGGGGGRPLVSAALSIAGAAAGSFGTGGGGAGPLATTGNPLAGFGADTFVPRFAHGGLFRGRGSTTSDSNAVLLSDREFIVNAESARRFLPQLQAINDNLALAPQQLMPPMVMPAPAGPAVAVDTRPIAAEVGALRGSIDRMGAGLMQVSHTQTELTRDIRRELRVARSRARFNTPADEGISFDGMGFSADQQFRTQAGFAERQRRRN